jgi:hypothetical protein
MFGKKEEGDVLKRRKEFKNDGGNIHGDDAMHKKIHGYKLTTEIPGPVIAMYQNMFSYMVDKDPGLLVTLAPDIDAMAQSLVFTQDNIRKMLTDLNIDVPKSAKTISGTELKDRLKKAVK